MRIHITNILLGMFFLLSFGCAEIPNQTLNKNADVSNYTGYKNHKKVRITYYNKHEDKYGSKIAMGVVIVIV